MRSDPIPTTRTGCERMVWLTRLISLSLDDVFRPTSLGRVSPYQPWTCFALPALGGYRPADLGMFALKRGPRVSGFQVLVIRLTPAALGPGAPAGPYRIKNQFPGLKPRAESCSPFGGDYADSLYCPFSAMGISGHRNMTVVSELDFSQLRKTVFGEVCDSARRRLQ